MSGMIFPRMATCHCGREYPAVVEYEVQAGCPRCRKLDAVSRSLSGPEYEDRVRSRPSAEHVYVIRGINL